MATASINKFGGLYLQPNSLTSKEGSFEQLENCVRIYDNIISARRGYQEAYRFPDTQVINLVFEYQDNIFAVSQNQVYRLYISPTTAQAACTNLSNVITVTKVAHGLTTGDYISQFFVEDTEAAFYNAFSERQAAFYGTFPITVTGLDTFTFTVSENASASVTTGSSSASYLYYVRQTGVPVSITAGGVERSRSLETNKNAYFLTDNGPLKLERDTLPILKAGIPQGLDLSGYLDLSPLGAITGPIQPNSQVAYRILFGRTDANENLVLGAPSEILTLINPKTDASSVSYSSPTLTINTTAPHGLTTGDLIQIFDLVGTGDVPPDRSQYTVTVTDPDTFTITFSGDIPSAVTSIAYGTFATPYIFFSIPTEITSIEYIYQVYRTQNSNSQDIVPDQRFLLVTEQNLTSPQISAGLVSYVDEIPDALLSNNAELYTNIDSAEGEGQANSRPPFAKDFALYKQRVMYANIKQYAALDLAVVAPNDISNGDLLTIAGSVYVARKNSGNNDAVANEIATSSATRVATTVTVTQSNHGFVSNDRIYVLEGSSINVALNIYQITVTGTNTFTFTSAGSAGTGDITYEGRYNASNQYLFKPWEEGLSTTTIAEAIDATARSIVKAVNRNSNSTVYAQYISGIGDIPGKMFFSAKNLSTTTFAATISAGGTAFFPTLPTSGTSVSATQESQINAIAISKPNESEAVPLLNIIFIGSANKAILRVATLRDSLIVVKEDGVYRVTGDGPENFAIVPIDVTVICKAKNSVAVLNNSVFCFSNQGVVQITDNSAQIVSRDIEPILAAILVQNPVNVTNAVTGFAYESDRHYILSALLPNSNTGVSNVCYVYNYLTNSWATWDTLFYTGTVIPSNDLGYYVDTVGSIIYRERKQQKKSDFTGQEFGVPVYLGKVASMDATLGLAELTVTVDIPHGLKVGDLITVAEVTDDLAALFSGGATDVLGLRLVTAINSLYTFTFDAQTNALGSLVEQETEYEDFISELNCQADAFLNSNIVTITTSIPHGLNTGQGITINSNTLSTAFPNAMDVNGYRTVTVLSLTVFTILATDISAADESGTANVTDGRQEYYYVTLKTPSDVAPEVGDAIIYDNILYKIIELYRYSDTRYLVKLNYSALFNSMAGTFLYSGITRRIKFSPLTMGDVSKIKFFDSFQAQFRAQGNCSAMALDYACDSAATTGIVNWTDRVGTGDQQITFDGWGEIAWGEDPWGEGENIEKSYATQPAVILRTYINLGAANGTFIQPSMTNRVAGEELNIQSISVDYENISTVSSR